MKLAVSGEDGEPSSLFIDLMFGGHLPMLLRHIVLGSRDTIVKQSDVTPALLELTV